MYNSRDDKSFTRACNYRPAWRYRVFSAVNISQNTERKKWIITRRGTCVRGQAAIFVNHHNRSVCRSIKAIAIVRTRFRRENYQKSNVDCRDYASYCTAKSAERNDLKYSSRESMIPAWGAVVKCSARNYCRRELNRTCFSGTRSLTRALTADVIKARDKARTFPVLVILGFYIRGTTCVTSSRNEENVDVAVCRMLFDEGKRVLSTWVRPGNYAPHRKSRFSASNESVFARGTVETWILTRLLLSWRSIDSLFPSLQFISVFSLLSHLDINKIRTCIEDSDLNVRFIETTKFSRVT